MLKNLKAVIARRFIPPSGGMGRRGDLFQATAIVYKIYLIHAMVARRRLLRRAASGLGSSQ